MYVSSQGTLMSSVSKRATVFEQLTLPKNGQTSPHESCLIMKNVHTNSSSHLLHDKVWKSRTQGTIFHIYTQSHSPWYVYNVKKNDDNETIKDHQITYPLHILSCQTVKQNTCVTWPVEVSRNNENWNDNNNIKKIKAVSTGSENSSTNVAMELIEHTNMKHDPDPWLMKLCTTSSNLHQNQCQTMMYRQDTDMI